MHVEGRLAIDLYPAAKANRVCIRSSRPLRAAQIFETRTPEEVLLQLPLLFSVCGIAQASAAVQALQQALDDSATAAADAARTLLVLMETAREHLWRVLIDWPVLLDEPADARRAAPLQPMLVASRKALFADGDGFSLQTEVRVDNTALLEQIDGLDAMLAGLVFGCPAEQWLRMAGIDALADWTHRSESVAARLLRQVWSAGWQSLGGADCAFLPELPEPALNRRLGAHDAGRFIAEPTWQERICETTPLARQCDCELINALRRDCGNGLLPRLAARLVELARLPTVMRALAAKLRSARSTDRRSVLPAGIGIGQVEAARGRLVHRVVLDDGCVRRYQILAPTEWNFHPAGVVARGLAGLVDTDEATLQRQAAMLINAVDPCVGYDLQVH